MTDPKMGPMLEEIGQLIADILNDKGPDGAFIYAEADDMWQEAGIFKDLRIPGTPRIPGTSRN
jgi:hypothetical protein